MAINKKYFKSNWFLTFLLIGFIGFLLYLFEVRPWLMSFELNGPDNIISFSPADTYTYWMQTSNPLILVPYNLMGPVIVLTIFNSNFDLLFLFFIFLFLVALKELQNYLKINPFHFATIFLINPLILFQFFAPNKEIIIIIALLFLVIYLKSRKVTHIFITLILSALSKPEFLVLILFFLIIRLLNKNLRPYIIILMIIVITYYYNFLPNMESQTEVLFRGQTTASRGVTVLFQTLAANYYLYPIIILPRILLTLFESSTLYLFLSGICFILALFRLITKERNQLNFRDDLFFLICLFIIMVSIVPFPHHRYILPIYPLILIILIRPKNIKSNLIERTKL